ncbi:MAG: site-2 protease family protein [Nitrospirota bacterium]
MMYQYIQYLSIVVLPLIFAITLHEAAHGWMANREGDPTAKLMGRLTLNPIAHIDLFGTIILPIMLIVLRSNMLFGYAKPVPVNFNNLRDRKKGMIYVAAAGPGINLILAVVSGIIYRTVINSEPSLLLYITRHSGFIPGGNMAVSVLVPIILMLSFSVKINVLLMVFNLIPIPPLDGGRILTGLLPNKQSQTFSSIEPFGMIILMILIFMDPLGIMRNILWPIIGIFTNYILGDIVI